MHYTNMMKGCIPADITDKEVEDLVEQAKDFVVSFGLVIRTKENLNSGDVVNHGPVSLFPSPVPHHCFEMACRVQTSFNLLMHKVAHDHQFLRDTLKHTIEVDVFAKHWWDVYIKSYEKGTTQPVSLAMNRSDYMLDCSNKDGDRKGMQIKQVEFNTMASSAGGLAVTVSKYHRYLLETSGHEDVSRRIPENDAVNGLAQGIVEAWKRYGKEKAAVIFLVRELEWNVYDQRHLEFAVRSAESRIKVLRRSIQAVRKLASLGTSKELFIDGYEIAVVYLRMCYSPNDFEGEQDWNALLMIERSRAISCPSARYFLAGTKKIQQELAQPGVLERFIENKDTIQLLRNTFAGQFSLDQGKEGDENIQKGISDPHKFVLKPQREGGGNNIYGDEIRTKLKQIQGTSERNAFILMERILPPVITNYGIWANQKVVRREMSNELGIFGVLVGTADEVFHNEQCGHLLRTKIHGTDEGGIATGFSCVDSPYLIE